MPRRCLTLIFASTVTPSIGMKILMPFVPPHLYQAVGWAVIAVTLALALALHTAVSRALKQAEERGAGDAITEMVALASSAAHQRRAQEPRSHPAGD